MATQRLTLFKDQQAEVKRLSDLKKIDFHGETEVQDSIIVCLSILKDKVGVKNKVKLLSVQKGLVAPTMRLKQRFDFDGVVVISHEEVEKSGLKPDLIVKNKKVIFP